ncbi:MAG TPA: LysR family transcriptional regulator [Frateuria sp.]|uniref:LysR family transcriptional regulator n=1 Tax=Frateuria sp. TaxID=2211372 RepID=UPI002D7E687A|nr:LysR family transcriptional regulator [Frateuria sp.]HET6806352.1 LysR family transcriptional regulator [Frateuria sp.]
MPNDLKLRGLAAFVAAVEEGSVSAAARRLGYSKSVVSERLAELEHALGARLLQRSTRRMSLTADGECFLPRARRILGEAKEAMAELTDRRSSLAGPLRISAPVSFGVLHLGPALYAFLAAHPGIELSLELDDRFVDAGADGFDAVLRHGPVTDCRLVAKRLATSRRILVASPAYLAREGTPASPDELGRHHGLLYINRETDWRFAVAGGWRVVHPRTSLRVNNGMVMRDAAVAGLGLTLLPTFFVRDELARGALEQVDVGAEAEGAELFLAYPRESGVPAKLAALIDSLKRSFGEPPYWDR